MIKRGEFKRDLCPEFKLEVFIQHLKEKQTDVEKAIRNMAKKKDKNDQPFSNKEKLDDIIEDLQIKELKGVVLNKKIKDELQSYDLLQNDLYIRLAPYEQILDDQY